jgi:Fe-Mn family superoxide dismutase
VYILPPLPYDVAALEPVIGAETMRTHHGKHHARYVNVTNEILGANAQPRPLEDVIADARERGERKLFNNAAQAWNHAFFWESMSSTQKSPSGALATAVEAAFGNLEGLRKAFITEGAGHFGSGWVWLLATNGRLEVVSSHDADLPWLGKNGSTPLLVCDVWEHAYYLDYKNERDRFLGAWFDRLANWDFAARQLEAAGKGGEGAYRYPLPS